MSTPPPPTGYPSQGSWQPPPSQPPRKSWPARHKVWTTVLAAFGVFVVLVIVGAAVGSPKSTGGSGTNDAASSTTAPAVSATSAAPPPPAAPNPQAKYSYTADYSIPSSIYGNVYLNGEIDVTNNGNIGVIVRCRLGWQVLGSPDITKTKRAHVAYGATKRIIYKVNGGSFSGNGGTLINNIQSWQNGHSNAPYGDDHCVITGTLGTAH